MGSGCVAALRSSSGRAGRRRRLARGRGRVVRPCDGVPLVLPVMDAGIAQQFPDDAGVALRPAGVRSQRGRAVAVLIVAPARAVSVRGGTRGEVTDENVREWQSVRLLGLPVAGQREDPGRAAAAAAVVPESGAQPVRLAGVDDGVPAPAGQGRPGGVAGDLRQQAECLGVASRAVAPAVAVAFDQFWPVLRVGVRDEEVVRAPASLREMTSAAPARAMSRRSPRPAAWPTAARAQATPSVPCEM